ncbi:MAG TPA: hypothetical protein V6D14_02815 [Coleofasciculaceae cyanobacterium]
MAAKSNYLFQKHPKIDTEDLDSIGRRRSLSLISGDRKKTSTLLVSCCIDTKCVPYSKP